MKIENLEWDSHFFGLRIGRLIVEDDKDFVVETFLSEAQSSFDLIYVFAFRKMLKPTLVLKSRLNLVDIMLTMSKSFYAPNIKTSEFEFRQSLSPAELADCYEIAEQTSEVARFNDEPLIGRERTKAMYRKWIDNALNQSFSDGIFIHKINKKIAGIHLIKTDSESKTAYFTLTGVNKTHIGKGIGKILWEYSYCYWKENHDITKVISPFSMQNIPSFNFHLKMGFNKIEEVKYIYHFRNNSF